MLTLFLFFNLQDGCAPKAQMKPKKIELQSPHYIQFLRYINGKATPYASPEVSPEVTPPRRRTQYRGEHADDEADSGPSSYATRSPPPPLTSLGRGRHFEAEGG